MLGLFKRSRAPARPLPSFRTRPSLEMLEDRNCPYAPMLMGLSATHIGDNLVVTGQVFDETPATVEVDLGGAVSAQVTPNASGQFSFVCPWPGGTTVTATATDDELLSSSQASATISNPSNANPFMTLAVNYGTQKQVTLSGRVYDESPGGLTVNFGGNASGTATTDAQGYFSATLTASQLGSVYAWTQDSAQNPSNTPSVILESSRPVIEDFTMSEQPNGWYLFSGRVVDESAPGLTVMFGGVPVSLSGKTATVEQDGWFYLSIQLNGTQSDEGTATVSVADWWGRLSEMAMCHVHQTGV